MLVRAVPALAQRASSRLLAVAAPASLLAPLGAAATLTTQAERSSSIHALAPRGMDGGAVALDNFRGKPIVVVNVASR
jgi:hypothetical protein